MTHPSDSSDPDVEDVVAPLTDEPHLRVRTRADLENCVAAAKTVLNGWLRSPATQKLQSTLNDIQRFDRFLRDGARPLRALSKISPTVVLTAAHEVVPFDDDMRAVELKKLADWCCEPSPNSVWLLTGAGGTGQTRVAATRDADAPETPSWLRPLRRQPAKPL